MKVGDLISFKPKSFSEDDWSNPGIVLESFEADDRQSGGWKDLLWVVWIDGGTYLVNARNASVLIVVRDNKIANTGCATIFHSSPLILPYYK